MKKVKICGLRRKEDILIVNRLKPDYVGFVFASGPGARTPASLTLSNAISINNVSIRPGNGTPLLAFAKDKIRFVGNTCV